MAKSVSRFLVITTEITNANWLFIFPKSL